MLASGAETEHVRMRLEQMASALGGSAEVFVSSERLLLSMRSGQSYRAKIGHPLQATAVNMAKLWALEDILDAARDRRIGLDEADRRIDAAEAAAPLHPPWLVVLAVAGTTACLARLFGAGATVVAAAFLAGIVNTLLRRQFAVRAVNPLAAAFVTAFISGLFGALLMKAVPGDAPTLCLVAAGMILVPGVPLINGIGDMATGHVGTGLARLASGAITVLAIGFGLFLAAIAAGDSLPVDTPTRLLSVPEDLLVSGLAAFGYAMLFNVPGRAVWACVVCGMASHGLRTALQGWGLDVAAATLLCATVAGLLAQWLGSRLRVPWTTFAFPGVVAMIPGSYAFRAATGSLGIMADGAHASATLVTETVSLAIATLVMTAAVGIGLLLASSLRQVLAGSKRTWFGVADE
jgi:uncharacterized membrane protein YjjP (DUF1212 family)